MAVVILEDLSLHYGEQVLLNKVNFTINDRDRICLVGRNGAGKSSLFRLLLGQNLPDGGIVRVSDGSTLAELPQALPAADDRNVMDVVLSGKAELGQILHDYNELAMTAHDDASMKKLERLQNQIEAQDGWLLQQKADSIIEKLNLPHEKSSVSDHVTISLGVASMKPKDPEKYKKLIEQADLMLYRAKHEGRNQLIYSH